MKEALKLALEALERYQIKRQDFDTFETVITAIEAALAQPEQEPDDMTIAYMSGLYDGKKKRPWVGLTKDKRLELYRQFEDCLESDDWEYEKAIEAKIKELNHG